MENTIPLILRDVARRYPDIPAQKFKNAEGKFQPLSYRELYDQVVTFASGLADLGVKRADHVGLISDNRREWLLADRAVLSLGAADVPRSCDTTEKEIAYILSFAECRVSFVENRRQLDKIIAAKRDLPALRMVIQFEEPSDDDRAAATAAGLTLHSVPDIFERGVKHRADHPAYVESEMDKGVTSEAATVIFTSGTTGEPKGVVLSHQNFIYQMEAIPMYFNPAFKPGQSWLSVLPIWHSFARILEYVAMGQAHTIAYSKPVASIMLPDFAAINPEWFGSVPRIWEAVMDGVYKNIRSHGGIKAKLFGFFIAVGMLYSTLRNHFLWLVPAFHTRLRVLESIVAFIPLMLLSPLYGLGNLLVFGKVKAKLGNRFMAGVSGGGALPRRVDRFYQALGVKLLEGYGLTESAPVISVRKFWRPVSGTIGPALPGTEVRIIAENGQLVGPGKQGIIHARGKQIMQGYLKKAELTAKVLSADGWLNTGDIGMLSRNGEIKITGRAKDTIVLRGGENIEPAPIEAKICESPYILQACVVGQDQLYIGALIVPREDAVTEFAKENGVMILDYETLLGQPEIIELVESEITTLVSPKNGFKIFERVVKFAILPEVFTAGKELSHKLDLARHKVADVHAKTIASLFKDRL